MVRVGSMNVRNGDSGILSIGQVNYLFLGGNGFLQSGLGLDL